MPLIILFIFFNTLFKYGEIFYTKNQNLWYEKLVFIGSVEIKTILMKHIMFFKKDLKRVKMWQTFMLINFHLCAIIETFSRLIVFIIQSFYRYF